MIPLREGARQFVAVLFYALVSTGWIGLLPAYAVDQYQIDGEFDGCDYGKLYPLVGGGILECQSMELSLELSPRVIAEGRQVLMIGNERVEGYLHDGQVFRTKVSDEFEGCDYDKVYQLDNGLLFQCRTYHFHYAYRPDVRITVVDGRRPIVTIDGDDYRGELFRR